MSLEFWKERNRQRFEIRKPCVSDWYKLCEFVKALRIEHENFVTEFGSEIFGPFVIEGGYGLENCESAFEWLEHLKRLEDNLGTLFPVEVYLVVDKVDNEVVGIVGLRFVDDDLVCHDLFGNVAMTIALEHRRFGIGSFVMDWVMRNWKEMSSRVLGKTSNKIRVSHRETNLASKEFITGLGGEFVDKVKMSKDLIWRYKITV